MERRASIRRPIHLKAQLSVDRLTSHACVISDFCTEGVFIQFSPRVAQTIALSQAEGERQTLLLSFTDASKQTEYRLPVRVVRLLDCAMGVQFTEMNADAVIALAQQAQTRRAGDQPAAVETPLPALQQCLFTMQQLVRPLFEQFLRELAAALLQAAETAPNETARQLFLDSYNAFRFQSTRLVHAFVQQVGSTLTVRQPAEPQGQGQPDVAELSMIEKSAFEDWLTLKVMMTKAETLYRADLLTLKMRLDKMGVPHGSGNLNPLGPPLLCYAFRDVVLALDLPPAVEKLCYRLFEKAVMKQLGSLFQELNRLLIRQGVLPELDLSRYLMQKPSALQAATKPSRLISAAETDAPLPDLNDRRRQERRQQQQSLRSVERRQRENRQGEDRRRFAAQPYSGTAAKHGDLAIESTLAARELGPAERSTFATVTRLFALLDQVRQSASGTGTETLAKTYWSFDEFQRGMVHLQEQRRNNPAMASRTSLRRQLETLLRRHTGLSKLLPQEQRDLLDVVDQFFVSLMRNTSLSDATRFQIRKLEIPLFRLLQRDEWLFDRRSAPILLIINRIAQLGAQGSRPSSAYAEQINLLINQICDGVEPDHRVVERVLLELNTMVERQSLLFHRNVERVTAAAEGAQKVSEAKSLVAQALGQRLRGRKIPRPLSNLINGGWRDLLSLTVIRLGTGHPLWQRYLDVLDQLLAVSDAPATMEDTAEVMAVLEEGLASIASSHLPTDHLLDEVRQFLLNSAASPVELVDMPLPGDEGAGAAEVISHDARRRGQQRWLARVQRLRPGDWFIYKPDDKESQNLRLVWVGRNASRFVLVSPQGSKVLDLEQHKLLSLLQRGVLIVNPDYEQSLVEQGVLTMVKDVYDQLSHATTYDPVTGLFRPKVFERHLETVLAGAGAESRHSLLYLDLRQFQLVQESAGGEGSDLVLAEISSLMQAGAAEALGLARMSGNEFAILLPHGEGMLQAQKLLKQIADYRLVWKNRSYALGVNIGVVEIEGGLEAVRCLKLAEKACRQAKAEGPNRIYRIYAGAGMSIQQEQMIARIADLSSELKSDRILLRCQKIIPLHAGTRVGVQYQVLMSVYDERGQQISATDFVRTAERYNRMQAVDRWVVGRMLDWMALNRSKLDSMGGISINLSGHSLNDESLLEFIFERLTQADAPIDKLCFEVTEAAAIANLHDVADFMQELREYGCKFCLGNFGSGMSSYQFLRKLPVDLIKVGGSFIRDLSQTPADQLMVRSMAEMVHFMGKELVATQVESKASLELLAGLNVDYAQGYCVEKPRLLTSF